MVAAQFFSLQYKNKYVMLLVVYIEDTHIFNVYKINYRVANKTNIFISSVWNQLLSPIYILRFDCCMLVSMRFCLPAPEIIVVLLIISNINAVCMQLTPGRASGRRNNAPILLIDTP